MRFIERIIFKNIDKLDFKPKLLNNTIKSEIEILKHKIINNSNWQDKKNPHKEIYVTNYKTKTPNTKQAASISLDNNLVLGLDKNGHIHTLYYSS